MRQVEKRHLGICCKFRSNWWIPDGGLYHMSSANPHLTFRISAVGPVGHGIEDGIWAFHDGHITGTLVGIVFGIDTTERALMRSGIDRSRERKSIRTNNLPAVGLEPTRALPLTRF
jgi:hypothetical protein